MQTGLKSSLSDPLITPVLKLGHHLRSMTLIHTCLQMTEQFEGNLMPFMENLLRVLLPVLLLLQHDNNEVSILQVP